MNRDAANRPDPAELDVLLSAYALGELGGADRALVERLLADPAADAARRHVAETRAVAEALRTARAENAPPRSADLRRAVVAALAKAPGAAVPTASPPARRTRLFGWLAVAGALAATLLVAVTLDWSAPLARFVAFRMEGPQTPRTAQPSAAPAPADGLARKRMVSADAKDDSIAAARSASAVANAQAPIDIDAQDLPMAAGERAARGQGGELPRQSEEKAEANGVPVPQAASPLGAAAAREMEVEALQLNDLVLVEESLAVKGSAGLGGRVASAAPPATRRVDAALDEARDVRAKGDRESLRRDQDRQADRERFDRFEENRFLAVADRPLSTFSIDVDTASYAVVRRFLSGGRLPPADAVRIEEFVNYFRYTYPQPVGDDPFAVALEATDCPWRDGHRLVRIGIAGRAVDRARRPSGNLVFLVDVSGSMDDPDKLPLVKQSLAMLVEELTENDRVSIVTYAGDAGLKLPPTSGDQKRRILDVVEGLSAGGSTNGSAGIELAYAQARERFVAGGANRVILCTDGDLNVGVTSDAALAELVQEKARGGTFLTVLGFGRGNLQDEKLETLADKGNGIYAYVDGLREARKVLVEQLTGSTITIAKDVKIQVEFNPAQVASYRLLGYENRRLADADFRDDTKDAGEIGAGHTVTALYEIVPTGAVAAGGDGAGGEPLKYQPTPARAAEPAPPAADGPASTELLTVKLRFKQPEGEVSVLREYPLADHGGPFATASADTRFAAAVAAFGMLLRSSEFRGEATLDTVSTIALDALGTDEGGYRAEFLDLVRRAQAITAADRRE